MFLCLIMAFALGTQLLPAAKKEKTSLRVLVLDEKGEPVPRASVIIRTLKGKKHNKVRHSYQLRTSQEGTAPLPPVEQGYVMIQVIAKGYQTYGEKVELREQEQIVRITLKLPQKQYSVHK